MPGLFSDDAHDACTNSRIIERKKNDFKIFNCNLKKAKHTQTLWLIESHFLIQKGVFCVCFITCCILKVLQLL